MKKKFILLLLIVLLVTGCGSSKNKENSTTTTKASTTTSTATTVLENPIEDEELSEEETSDESTTTTTTTTKTTTTTTKKTTTTTTKKVTTTTTKQTTRSILGCWEVEGYSDSDDFAGFIIGSSNVLTRFSYWFAYYYSGDNNTNLYYESGNKRNGIYYTYEILSSNNTTVKIKIEGANYYRKENDELICDNSYWHAEYTYTWKDDNTIINASNGKVLKRVSCSDFLPESYRNPEC